MKDNREQLNKIFICFSNKETINKVMSVKKSCILKCVKYVKRRSKDSLKIFLIWYLKPENGTLNLFYIIYMYICIYI